jgi:hypothetical protein
MPIVLAAHRGLAATLLAWKQGSTFHVTIIAKMTARLVANGPAEIVAPRPLERVDRFANADPTQDFIAARDLSPMLPRCDVTVVGSAWAPPTATTDAAGNRSFSARMTLFRDQTPLLDKAMTVVARPGEDALPLSYRRALGAPAAPDNPIGTAKPAFVDPVDPRRPIGLGPIPKFWPRRKRQTEGRPMPAQRDGALEVPPGFSFELLQSAPPDQQAPLLHGNEWIVLQNLSRRGAEIRARLPAEKAFARVWWAGRKVDVGLAIDTLVLRPDDGEMDLVARGAVALGGAMPSDLRAAVNLVHPVTTADWGTLALIEPALAEPLTAMRPDETCAVDSAIEGRAVLPFPEAPRSSPAPASRAGGTPWGGPVILANLPPARSAAQAPPPASPPARVSAAAPSVQAVPTPAVPAHHVVAPAPAVVAPPHAPALAPAVVAPPHAPAPAPAVVAPPHAPALAPALVAPPHVPALAPPLVAPPHVARVVAAPALAPPAAVAPVSVEPRAPASAPAPATSRSASPWPPGPRMPAANIEESPLIARLRAAGAREGDLAALVSRLAPPQPPPPED